MYVINLAVYLADASYTPQRCHTVRKYARIGVNVYIIREFEFHRKVINKLLEFGVLAGEWVALTGKTKHG